MSRYTVEERLAAGGMGTVYRVFDTVAGTRLALKRLKLHAGAARSDAALRTGSATHQITAKEAQRALAVDSFEREYQVLASLNHPRIIRVFDYGVDESGPYYTMELIEGEDLRRGAPVPYRQACLYLRDVATCLALLHARRFIHRDLSPSNVRRTADGHCKVLDFGALTTFGRPTSIVGTPPCVPPEAIQYVALDQRADLYALGALGYWILTGQHAYPARELSALFACWKHPPGRPSALTAGIPSELDELILSLLSLDPLGRPGSAGEVIARLNVIGELPVQDRTEAVRLADSFLLNPAFIGRKAQLTAVQARLDALSDGSGGAFHIHAAPGLGRTRLLEEVAVLAQLTGATVLRADARSHGSMRGIPRAFVARLFAAHPDLARRHAGLSRGALRALGPEIESLMADAVQSERVDPAADGAGLEAWFAEISRQQPLALLVDNVEHADDASLALLASAARLSRDHPILVVVTERSQGDLSPPVGLLTLRSHSTPLDLPALDASEMLELMRSLFGDAPNVKRFAQWIHQRSAGSPLHAVEIVRQLVAKQVIQYTDGIWTLPIDTPDASVPEALEDMLSLRIAAISEQSRTIAECLSLQRERPTFELCRLIASSMQERDLLSSLGELTRNDVLHAEGDEYRFSSLALCDVLLAGMDSRRLERNHRRVGEALAQLAGDTQAALAIQAGWHLIQGGEEMRGATMIARIAGDPVMIRTLLANLHRPGRALDAALTVYGTHGRSLYERLPLLASLAQAGYYESRAYAERYADAALDALELVSGLRSARLLRRFLGRWLGLIAGILFAALRFFMAPRVERPYSFKQVLTHLFGTVTALSASAAVTLDSQRGERYAEVLEPFAILPARLTPVGVYEYCKGLAQIARDNGPTTYEKFDEMLRRFQDPRYYPSLPEDARKVYVAAAHFARGSFAVFRAHGAAALEDAAALDRCGLTMYVAIASQLRFLYHMNRGEFAQAAVHREEFELRAAHLGSLWQVETWESPALILVYTLLSDIVSSQRLVHRLELLSRSVPTLKRYAYRAKEGLMRSRKDPKYVELVLEEQGKDEPRSYIGWAAATAFWAGGYNMFGLHAEAKRVCEKALKHLVDEDREYVSLFLNLDIQLAIADAGLGDFAAGLARTDALLERFADCDHPLACGLLHETKARIAFAAGQVDVYDKSLLDVERWFVKTGTPILIARYQRLAELKPTEVAAEPAAPTPDADGNFTATVAEWRTRTLCGPELLGPST
ncbi:MAG TPA: protein kinase [Polyangiaceae bacterium]